MDDRRAAEGGHGRVLNPVEVGCSGWSYNHWRERVYGNRPPSGWLEQYAQHFSTVEINATFYRLPAAKTVEGWARRSPDGFCFAVKVSRYLTHIRRLDDVREGWGRLLELVRPLDEAGKLGPLLWQLPGSFERDDSRLADTLSILTSHRHCFEFRHPSWFCEPVMRLLREAGAALVIGDAPNRPFQTHELTADWTYIRFHYGARGRRGNYSPTELDEWAARIAAWSQQADVYAYFNNDWEAFAWHNAEDLIGRLRPPSALQNAGGAAQAVSSTR